MSSRTKERYGPWAIVTGASDGIGRAFAERLARDGLDLVLVARRREVLETLAAELSRREGIATRVLPLDLSRTDELARLERETASLDVGLLVAAAGFGTSGSFVDGPIERELALLDVNCRAVLVLAHAFGRRFSQRGRGGLVLMSSLLAFQGVPLAAHYAASKAYVQSLAEGLRLELAPAGVDVVACAPGPVASGFAAVADMQMSFALDPASVPKPTLAALGRRTTVRPGWLSKLLEASLKLPRWARVRILGRVMAGMTRHRDGAPGAADAGSISRDSHRRPGSLAPRRP